MGVGSSVCWGVDRVVSSGNDSAYGIKLWLNYGYDLSSSGGFFDSFIL